MDKERTHKKRALGDFCEQFDNKVILKDSFHKKIKPNKMVWLKRPPPKR